MRIHRAFYVNRLQPANVEPLPGQKPLSPPHVEVDGEKEYKVEEVLDSFIERCSRGSCHHLMYVVRLVGYTEPTADPADHLLHASQLVKNSHRTYPHKPGPTI